MRTALWHIINALGIPAGMRFLHRHHLTIALYHGVAPREQFGIYNYRGKFIAPEAFEAHLRYFAAHYTVLKLDEAIEKFQTGTLPPYALAITFDDGYRNFYEYAAPLLKKYEMPATIFITTGFMLRQEPLWVDRLEYACGQQSGSREQNARVDAMLRQQLKTLPPKEREAALANLEKDVKALHDFKNERSVYAPLEPHMLKELQKYGITIGAHTQTHPILSRLTRARASEEIAGSRNELLAAVHPVSPTFAYPNGQRGDYTQDTLDAVRSAGFKAALTTVEGSNAPGANLYELKRITLDNIADEAILSAAISGARAAIRTCLLWKKK